MLYFIVWVILSAFLILQLIIAVLIEQVASPLYPAAVVARCIYHDSLLVCAYRVTGPEVGPEPPNPRLFLCLQSTGSLGSAPKASPGFSFSRPRR